MAARDVPGRVKVAIQVEPPGASKMLSCWVPVGRVIQGLKG
jgi:hypothetical protein